MMLLVLWPSISKGILGVVVLVVVVLLFEEKGGEFPHRKRSQQRIVSVLFVVVEVIKFEFVFVEAVSWGFDLDFDAVFVVLFAVFVEQRSRKRHLVLFRVGVVRAAIVQVVVVNVLAKGKGVSERANGFQHRRSGRNLALVFR